MSFDEIRPPPVLRRINLINFHRRFLAFRADARICSKHSNQLSLGPDNLHNRMKVALARRNRWSVSSANIKQLAVGGHATSREQDRFGSQDWINLIEISSKCHVIFRIYFEVCPHICAWSLRPPIPRNCAPSRSLGSCADAFLGLRTNHLQSTAR